MNFKQLVLMNLQALTNFPYIEKDFDAVTDYQLLCLVVDHLNEVIKNSNEVIKNSNEQNTVIQNLYNAFVTLKDYVDNYFDNLDIQEEIDNKLDEMAKSGELSDIIAQYLEVASVLAFDTKASLKSADNLVNGSITRTLGDVTYNDGKGSYYKIRTITSSDVIDDNNILALANFPTLIAEKIITKIEKDVEVLIDSPINVKLYGVVGDGVTDDSTAIQNIIDNNPGKTLYFPQGDYGITTPINLYKQNDKLVNIIMDNNATIKNISNTTIETLFNVGYDENGIHNRFLFPNTSYIKGGTLDCHNTNYGIKVYPLLRLLEISDVNFIKINNTGLLSDYDSGNNIEVGNLHINNCYFQGLSSNESNSTAIVINSTDNDIRNITIDRTKKGITVNGWGNNFINIHATAMFTNTPSSSQRNDTICFECNNTNSWNSFNNCYSDTYAIGFKVNGSMLYLTECKTYWYYSDSNTIYNCVLVNNFNEEVTKLDMINCDFNLPSQGSNKHISCSSDGYTDNDNFSFVNCNFNVNDTIPKDDPAYCVQVNNKTSVNCDKQDYTPMAQNQNVFYPIAILKGNISVFDYNIQYAWDGYSKVYHTLTSWLSNINIKTGNGFYLSVIDKNGTYYLCVSTDIASAHKNFVLNNISNNRNCKIFAREDLFRGMSFSNVSPGNIKFKHKIFE